MQKRHDLITTIVFGLLFLVGLSVMCYPAFSDWWNRNISSHTVSGYREHVAALDQTETERILSAARDYNQRLASLQSPLSDFESIPGYEDTLNISGSGIMGYVSIPNIKVELPIYHGTGESILQIASGHIQGTSLPVGGAGTHAVISGHRGLPSAKLFSDLDQITEGDIFTIHILDEVLTYEVDQILIILPTETDKLSIIPGEDRVTLMTCTPYGVNTHRLLIRGRRIETMSDKKIKVTADALQVDPMTVIPIVFMPLLLLLFLYWHVSGKRSRRIRIDRYTIRELPRRDDRNP